MKTGETDGGRGAGEHRPARISVRRWGGVHRPVLPRRQPAIQVPSRRQLPTDFASSGWLWDVDYAEFSRPCTAANQTKVSSTG
jgi:hypothetical protein